MKDKIKEIKKIELHMHLDGSVRISTISSITGEDEDTLKKKMTVSSDTTNLSEYLEKFSFPLEFMQTRENLTLITRDIVGFLESENVIYAEIRFAPMLHTKKGLSYNEIIDSVIAGLKQNNNVKTNLILCMLRESSLEENMKTIESAKEYLGKCVCAIDLAGDESKFPTADYLPLFEEADKLNIPYTIHAGECGSPDEVITSLKTKTKRIGHGIASIKDKELIKNLKEQNITLEVCPTSNIQTSDLTYESHPIKELYDLGVNVTVNTDNPTVSNTTLTEEYMHLLNIGFTLNDIDRMNETAIEASFLSPEEKANLHTARK